MIDAGFVELVTFQLVQVTALTLVFGVLARRLMKHRPHLAHLMLLFVFIKCLVPPIVPGPWIPRMTSANVAHEPHDEAATSILATESTTPLNLASKAACDILSPNARPHDEKSDRFSFVVAVATCWLLGFLVTSSWMVGPWLVATFRWHDQARSCPPELQRLCDRLSVQLGVKRSVRIVVDEREYGPLVTGWFRPQVVLPACLVESNDEINLRMSIAHELVHLRRWDTAYSVLQCVARAVWWFHPGVWWTSRLIDQAAERCCDEEVISALQCKPTRYAQCLVAILEKKLRIQHLAVFPGSRPGGVTAVRLASLKKPAANFCQRAPWYYWVVFFTLAILLIPSRPSLSATRLPTDTGKNMQTPISAAAAAFERKDYSAAAVAYRRIIEQQPSNGFAWSRLGFALHSLDRLDEALEAHQKAADFPLTRANATYNIACVHSRQGRQDLALAAFEKAIGFGYRAERKYIEQDPDLAGLRNDSRFKALLAKASSKQTPSRYRQLDFMIGNWQVRDPQGKLLGHSRIYKEERGFLLTEKWTAVDGSTGTGITYIDPKNQLWQQTFVGMFGGVIDVRGTFADGELRMNGDNALPTRDVSLVRSVTRPLSDGSFRFLMEKSSDNGQTWDRTFDGQYLPASRAN